MTEPPSKTVGQHLTFVSNILQRWKYAAVFLIRGTTTPGALSKTTRELAAFRGQIQRQQ